jgi:hypothetical protein
MRFRSIVILGASTLALSGCGSAGGKSPTKPTPATPVNLTVYVNDSRISISPTEVGAGPVVFIVTNQASHAEALAISATGHQQPLASTAPINPQGTTQVSVNFKPGDYTIATAAHGETDAQRARPSNIAPASLHIGRARPSASGSLLEP